MNITPVPGISRHCCLRLRQLSETPLLFLSAWILSRNQRIRHLHTTFSLRYKTLRWAVSNRVGVPRCCCRNVSKKNMSLLFFGQDSGFVYFRERKIKGPKPGATVTTHRKSRLEGLKPLGEASSFYEQITVQSATTGSTLEQRRDTSATPFCVETEITLLRERRRDTVIMTSIEVAACAAVCRYSTICIIFNSSFAEYQFVNRIFRIQEWVTTNCLYFVHRPSQPYLSEITQCNWYFYEQVNGMI